jgi:hypothetical protein
MGDGANRPAESRGDPISRVIAMGYEGKIFLEKL